MSKNESIKKFLKKLPEIYIDDMKNVLSIIIDKYYFVEQHNAIILITQIEQHIINLGIVEYYDPINKIALLEDKGPHILKTKIKKDVNIVNMMKKGVKIGKLKIS